MKLSLIALCLPFIFQTAAAWAQTAPTGDGFSSSSQDRAYGSPVASQDFSPSTLSILKAMPGTLFGQAQVEGSTVAIDKDIHVSLMDAPAVPTREDSTHASRNLVTRRQNVQIIPGKHSYFLHLCETECANAAHVNDVYLRVDVNNNDNVSAEISFFTQKPATSVEGIFKPVKTKIDGTLLANIQIKKPATTNANANTVSSKTPTATSAQPVIFPSVAARAFQYNANPKQGAQANPR